ncbi:MAG: hypothetical protein WEA59_04705 [Ferruginibacter sp.]
MLNLPPPTLKVAIPVRQRILEKTGTDITLCTACKRGTMEVIATYRNGFLCKRYEQKARYIPAGITKNKARITFSTKILSAFRFSLETLLIQSIVMFFLSIIFYKLALNQV